MIISKKRTRGIIILSAAMVFVIVTVILLTSNSLKSKASSNGRTYDGTEMFYVNLSNCGNSWWTNSGCYQRAYFFGTDKNWVSLSKNSEGIYYAKVPVGTYTGIILCRTSTNSTTWSSGKVYNQTGDIVIDDTLNYISYFKGSKSATATWSSYGTIATQAPTDIPTIAPTVEVTIAPTKAATAAPTVAPTVLVSSNAVTVYYYNSKSWSNVYIHYGINDSWTTVPGYKMSVTSNSKYYYYTIDLGTATSAKVCFNNGSGTWDSNNGSNYSVATGAYTVKSASVTASAPSGVTIGTTTAVPTAAATATVSPTVAATITPTTVATTTPSNDYGLVDDVQDGVILHAFNWSYDNIKNNLSKIASAGYTTVQTSPVQQPKDYGATWTDVSGQWWKLYQPCSFSVAENSWLGNATDLSELCAEADNYGIKIICDIVANHMANDNSSTTGLNSLINTYESTLYNGSNTYFHPYADCSDSSIYNVVYGNLGMPDLNTSNSYVQSRVINLLKQCVDCGVDGFRFDAAKHIETPSDSSNSSNFWSNVLGTTKSYATSKGVDIYYYGEILNTCGTGRSYSSYTNLMSVTDNKTGDAILYGVYSSNQGMAGSYSYYTGQSADKLVLWAESHDTYMGSSGSMGLSNTASASQAQVNRAYAIVASRVDAASLYFVRPGSATMGNVGSSSWYNTEISEVNKYHNKFAGSSEYHTYSNYVVLNERYYTNSSSSGAVLVYTKGGTKSVSMTCNKLTSGTYTDKITGNKFTVSGGKVSGTIGSTGIAVLY